uniref:Uncharacterized protein n=1 Tax=Coccidioides posadasii RMSCC 3488 TaxID=454284 RepID=A0A0J6FRA8_COCPO|nr:hypothetical protein CPAG_07866 [Coccidioides posadasii RMSCC 3488]
MILIKIGETAKSHLDSIVNNTGMTVPAYFNNSQCQAIKNASLIANFNIFYTLNKLNITIIIYDFELNMYFKNSAESSQLLVQILASYKLTSSLNKLFCKILFAKQAL